MNTSELTAKHIGQKGTFPLKNDGGEVTGTLTRVRHAAQGTYIEVEEFLGVYQTDPSRDIGDAP